MKELPIMPFNEDNVGKILNVIGFSLDEEGRIIDKGKIKNCECCQSVLTKKNLGNIFPANSPHHLFCDNPFCITDYVRKNFLKV